MAHGYRGAPKPKATPSQGGKGNTAAVKDPVIPVAGPRSTLKIPTPEEVMETPILGAFAAPPARAYLMSKLEDVLQRLHLELGADFISSDVVGKDGISIAGGSIDPAFNSTMASARFAGVMELASRASGKIKLGKVEENLVTTDRVYIIARLVGDGSYYWYLAIRREATLGSVLLIMNEYAPKLWNAIAH
jgi:predicted regulator of Ras-like GTPase activity (Roadblock/LC7/MglB family)